MLNLLINHANGRVNPADIPEEIVDELATGLTVEEQVLNDEKTELVIRSKFFEVPPQSTMTVGRWAARIKVVNAEVDDVFYGYEDRFNIVTAFMFTDSTTNSPTKISNFPSVAKGRYIGHFATDEEFIKHFFVDGGEEWFLDAIDWDEAKEPFLRSYRSHNGYYFAPDYR